MTDSATSFQIHPLHPAIGVEVRDIDFRQSLDPATRDALRKAWVEHMVLVMPDQDITDAEQVRFSRQFGELEIFPQAANRSRDNPEVFRVSNTDQAGNLLDPDDPAGKFVSATQHWHTDSCYREVPCMGAILHGIEVTRGRGDTIFVNLAAAYQALPDDKKAALEGLKAVHSFQHMRGYRSLPAKDENEAEAVPDVVQPLLRTNPDTGRRSIYLSPLYMKEIVGLSPAAGRALVEDLTAWCTQERFAYRHKWRRHDIVMWDNRSTMHLVTPFDRAHVPRIMHRTTIAGDAPVA